MSLQSQLNSFVTRVAEMFQQVETRTGALDRLNTSAKSDLVTAINELAAREIGGGSSGVAFTHSQVSAWRILLALASMTRCCLVAKGILRAARTKCRRKARKISGPPTWAM